MTDGTSGNDTTPVGDAAPAGDGGAQTTREWMAGLPDDLRGDATLARYETPEALARGHLEARRALSGRVAVPGKDADDATRNAFYTAIGRPEKADGYQFEVPDNDAARASAGKFGEFAFGLGMPKDMAEAVVKFDNERQSAQLQAYQDNARAEFDTWKADKPDAEARISQIGNLFKRFNIGELDAAEIEARLGTAKMFDLFDGIAKATGEHARQDGDTGRTDPPSGEDADKAFSKRVADPQFRADVAAGKTEAVEEYNRLLQARRDAAKPRKPA